jgi:hypothetical protein
MQDLGYELPRIPIPRTWVNKPSLWHFLDKNSSGIHRRPLRYKTYVVSAEGVERRMLSLAPFFETTRKQKKSLIWGR